MLSVGTFAEIFGKVRAIPDTLPLLTDDPWYRDYVATCRANYAKPYPRPFPCGSVVLGFDRREAELIGHRLDISNGLCEVTLLTRARETLRLQVFTDLHGDRLWLRLIDHDGRPAARRLRPAPHPPGPVHPEGVSRLRRPRGSRRRDDFLPPGPAQPGTGPLRPQRRPPAGQGVPPDRRSGVHPREDRPDRLERQPGGNGADGGGNHRERSVHRLHDP